MEKLRLEKEKEGLIHKHFNIIRSVYTNTYIYDRYKTNILHREAITNTHTHTHIYIYIYIYLGGPLLIRFVRRSNKSTNQNNKWIPTNDLKPVPYMAFKYLN